MVLSLVSLSRALSVPREIPRVSWLDASVATSHPFATPVVIQGVWSATECDVLGDRIMNPQIPSGTSTTSTTLPTLLVQRRVTHQRGPASRGPQAQTQERAVSLSDAVNLLLHSHHQDARWCFHEGFLHEHAEWYATVTQRLTDVHKAVFQASSHCPNPDIGVNAVDWFSFFPTWARPSTDCVIWSGVGATSTLHRDPLEWTGTSVCIEGSKVWRFIDPNHSVQTVDHALQSYRLPSHAWSTETAHPVTLSAGWQSDYSLFRTQHGNASKPSDSDAAPSLHALAPDPDVWTNGLSSDHVWTTVQRPGDFVIIPAHWWHQTYALEPSLTISSQWCSHHDAPRVLAHMVDSTGVAPDQRPVCDCASPRQSVADFFAWLEASL